MYFLLQSRHTTPYQVKPNTLSLSFNGVPSPSYMKEIIAILNKKNINATFFISAKDAENYPEVISEAYEKGNAIACLGLNNKDTSDKQIEEDLKKCKNSIEKIIGKAPICYRPAIKVINMALQNYIKAQNMVIIEDGISVVNEENLTIDAIIFNTLSLIRPQGIINFASPVDEGEAQVTLKALPILIEKIEKMGLGFSRICYP